MLSIGLVHELIVNQVYALPARAVTVFIQGGNVQISNDGTNWTNFSSGNKIRARFVRATGNGRVITFGAD